jgi:aldehyde:ferredoxin oxidoreductase
VGDLTQFYGINNFELLVMTYGYLYGLYQMGDIGPGTAVDTAPLNMEQWGTFSYSEEFMKAIAYREGIGDDLAEGIIRAAKKWGTLERDLGTGLLLSPQWGFSSHHTLPTIEWAYGSLMGDRDINEHIYGLWFSQDIHDAIPAETLVQMLSQKTAPYTGDPLMFNYAWQWADGSNITQALEEGIYSIHKAKHVAWDRHYLRFYRQALGYCDWGTWPSIISPNAPAGDNWGTSPEAETRFFNAVTGKNLTFEQGMEIGRRIWNLQRCMWVLQGRDREMEVFSGYMYTPAGGNDSTKTLPVKHADGTWTIEVLGDLFLDYDGVENWKTLYYDLEGWNTTTGWPKRSTLEALDLGFAADKLEAAGKLGAE